MAMYKATLFDLEGEVLQFRPLASPTLVERWINARIRQAIDSRTYWSSLLTRGILNIPAAYKTGTVSIPNGSTVVTGSATAWPVNDVVNTTIPAGVSDLQYVEVTPVSMTGITNDSWVLVDTGASAEAVAVIETTATTFTAKFSKTHAASCTVTASRLAGRQLFLGAQFSPYLVTAVTSATTLLIQLPWGGPAATAVPYQIIQVYYSFASDMKDLLCVVDPSQPYELELHVPLAKVNADDPQRTGSGQPMWVVDHSPDDRGNMQYEIYPWQVQPYTLNFMYTREWPELRNPTDRPPWFINPTVFVHGAIADALRYRSGKDDPFFNPTLARDYEQMFNAGLERAKNADESKAIQDYQYNWRAMGMGNVAPDYWQSHVPDICEWSV